MGVTAMRSRSYPSVWMLAAIAATVLWVWPGVARAATLPAETTPHAATGGRHAVPVFVDCAGNWYPAP